MIDFLAEHPIATVVVIFFLAFIISVFVVTKNYDYQNGERYQKIEIDGTQCIVINPGAKGASISCNWK